MRRWFNLSHDADSQAVHVPRPLASKIVLPLLAVWLLTIAVGLAIAIDHEARPAAAAIAGPCWPPTTQLELASKGSTLVMFLHPECPCSGASLEQFDALLHSCGPAAPMAHIVVVGQGANESSRNAARAGEISGAQLSFDPEGTEAERFGSRTSGDVLIYDTSGTLIFCGGITAGRGHQGDNLAAAAAKNAATGSASELTRMPVFGCALRDSDEE